MKLIFGLGNSDKKYNNTRHNIGYILLDKLFKDKENVRFIKPDCSINDSGKFIKKMCDHYKVDYTKDILVIVDDINLELGKIKLKNTGSSGGHNGLKDIENYLSQDYHRLRIGIGSNFEKGEQIKYVLSEFLDEEMEKISHNCERIKQIIQSFIEGLSIEKIKTKHSV